MRVAGEEQLGRCAAKQIKYHLLYFNFWFTIQNTANRQVRNLFLEVSWLYLSRLLLRAGVREEPNLWLLDLRLLVPRMLLCLVSISCVHFPDFGLLLAFLFAVCCCSAAAEKKTF